jgi:hypothetical protein
MSLLEKVYLPDLEQRNIRNSDAYKTLKENNLDTSILEGYESQSKFTPIEFKELDTFQDKEEWIAKHAGPEQQKEFFSNVGDFLLETGKDSILSLGVAAINGADVATNLMPLFAKVLDNSPITGVTGGFMNAETEEQVYNSAKYVSENLDKARDYLKSFKEDDNVVSQLIGVMGQDLVYSIPIYNKLRDLGVPKYPAFFISGGIGGAIGVEDKILGGESTFSQSYLAKDIIELKNLIGILPNTPEDKIADEVVQALEYGAFSVAIPGIIDAFKFMKRYIPAFSTAGVGTVAMTAGNEAEGSPIKAIVNAVDNVPMFKSGVVTAAEKLPASGKGDQVYNTIVNTPGVKQSELKWMDLEGFLKGKDKVSKDEVLNFINENRIDVSEVKLRANNRSELPVELRTRVTDYETRWRDSNLADTASPNYDRYNIRIINKVVAGIDGNNNKGRVIPQDWSSTKVSPFISSLNETADFIGTGTSWKGAQKYLNAAGWQQGDKYVGHLIRVKKENLGSWTNDIHFVRSTRIDGSAEIYLITSDKLKSLKKKGAKFTETTRYEMDALELERFHLEDDLRNERLRNNNTPVYEKYTEPGGEDYTELVFKLKTKDMTTPAILEGEFGTLANNKVKTTQKTSIDFMSPHFNRPNEFAHVRFKTRELPNGKKALVVEEMQSDLLQASKTDLFDPSSAIMRNSTQGKVLKDFPFKNTWYEFTIKRLARYAADNGFDAIAIPKGSLAANRYGQETFKAKKIRIEPDIDNQTGEALSDNFELSWYDDKNELVKSVRMNADDEYFFENLKRFEKDISGNFAEFQSKITEATSEYKALDFDFPAEATLGSGAGKFRLYDKTIPSYMKKYAKKWNAKVYDDTIEYVSGIEDLPKKDQKMFAPEVEIPVTVLELSPEMKKDVVSSSQPLFEIFGTVGLSTWIADEVSDSMQNNIISTSTEKMY